MLFSKGNSYRSGLFAESIAKIYLRLHGVKILHSRYITGKHTNRAEIDIIAKHGDVLIFIEVKKRNTITNGFEAITPQQIQRLRRAAETFIIKHKWNKNARFDVIIVYKYGIKWIKNAI